MPDSKRESQPALLHRGCNAVLEQTSFHLPVCQEAKALIREVEPGLLSGDTVEEGSHFSEGCHSPGGNSELSLV